LNTEKKLEYISNLQSI